MLTLSFPVMVEPEILLDDDMPRRMFPFREKIIFGRGRKGEMCMKGNFGRGRRRKNAKKRVSAMAENINIAQF